MFEIKSNKLIQRVIMVTVLMIGLFFVPSTLIAQDSREQLSNTCLVEMSFALIPAGEFQMGSKIGSENGKEDERPVRNVKISQDFWMQTTEVTQLQWMLSMGNNPSEFNSCLDCPVEQVSWDDAEKYIAKLNERKDGWKYRLPTEAEWEYAARAGTTGDYAGTLESMAWYNSNSGFNTHPVGQKSANAWGLYDMHGNVWEWVQDRYGDYPIGSVTDPTGPKSGSFRVGRGGGWGSSAPYLRSADRDSNSPYSRYGDLGFRLVRTK